MRRLFLLALPALALVLGGCSTDPESPAAAPDSPTVTSPATTTSPPAIPSSTTTSSTTTSSTTTSSTTTSSTSSTTTSTTSSTTSTTTTTEAAGSSFAPGGPGRWEGEVVLGDDVRRFVAHIPESMESPAPLVLVLHGFTEEPEDAERLSSMHEVALREGFVVVYPAATGAIPAWRTDTLFQGDSDVRFLREVVGVVAAAVPIDDRSVYAAGMSNGGGMAVRLGCEAEDLVAAVATVSGAHSDRVCRPSRPVPLVAFHGTADPIVPYEGFGPLFPALEPWAAQWADRNGCRSDPIVTTETPDVILRSWSDCTDAADVLLYTIEGGEHGWPGSDRAATEGDSTTTIDASEIMWAFFAAHPMP